MLILSLAPAAIALGAVALRPRSAPAAALAGACALTELLFGRVSAAAAAGALWTVLPVGLFLAAAMALAAQASRCGLAERLADALARVARGRLGRLYALSCALCALLTLALSLDGAIVVVVAVLGELRRRHGVPLGPLLVGAIAVANASSLALPQGNPTNLLVMGRLGLGAGAFAARMCVPALLATLIAAGAPALRHRASLRGRYPPPAPGGRSLSGAQRRAAAAFGAAAVGAALSPLVGLPPWAPMCVVAALALGIERLRGGVLARPRLSLRLLCQLAGLLVVLEAAVRGLGLGGPAALPASLPALLSVALLAAIAAALANNLPASAAAGGLLAAGAGGYAALIGLSVGALATPQGSVATLIAHELVGPGVPGTSVAEHLRTLAPAALLAALAATVWLWLGSGARS
jgi:arsenical pump membrane protein